MGDFRPVSLVGSLYKIFSKVLASRLSSVMDKLISPNQSSFLKARLLVDGVVAVNELVDFLKHNKEPYLLFKVDFEKSYNSVRWSFLYYMLFRFGFSDKWRGWIRAYVFCGNLAVLVNGCSACEININRGLKQGDHLAPFLFLLVDGDLSGLISRVVEMALFTVIKVGSSDLLISHLQYVDDTIFFGQCHC